MVAVLAVIALIISLILSLFQKFKPKIKKKLKEIKQNFVWSGLIRSQLLSYFSTCILWKSKVEVYLTYISNPLLRNGEDLAIGLALMTGTFAIPVGLMYLVYKRRENLGEQFKIISEGFYSSSNNWKTSGYWHYPLMFLRRWVFCFIPVIFFKWAFFQYQGLVISTLIYSGLYFEIRP